MIADYSKFINLDEWPPKPEPKKEAGAEPKNEMMENIRKHFADNPEALTEFQNEINNQNTNPENQDVKSLINLEDVKDYLKNKK
ncbi:hypothetical protein [Chryseobacterium turcicum]|uniref:Uncharacterized protein n=1 Tax=Chryseobacterium turcicum TaxID=2898076 RepID=A0A9Q3YUC6_9FLAO|nr:hypothetical protein [Chryseobacterium turcicum]MCD1115603.1 hypothetical protein [Chryseobacterium turcicum]